MSETGAWLLEDAAEDIESLEQARYVAFEGYGDYELAEFATYVIEQLIERVKRAEADRSALSKAEEMKE